MRLLVAVKRVIDYNARVRVKADKVIVFFILCNIVQGLVFGLGVLFFLTVSPASATAVWR